MRAFALRMIAQSGQNLTLRQWPAVTIKCGNPRQLALKGLQLCDAGAHIRFWSPSLKCD